MSVHGPLGATEGGSVEVTARAVATRAPSRALSDRRLSVLGLVGLLASTMIVAIAAAKTDAVLPESVRPIPGWLAGPFGSTGLGLSSGELILVLAAMFASYVLAVRGAERVSPAVMLMCIAALNALVLLAPPLLSTDVFS